MKIFLLLALMAVVPSARADVSDSGNLSIGGNGVIFGSMTVIGPIAASSVTLSSSGAGAYDLTTSTGIHVLSGAIRMESGAYIKWFDNSTSTTASSGGGGSGNVVLSATQTFSGANTFTSSVTIGPTVYTTTASFNNIVVNAWNVVASSAPSGSTGILFTGLRARPYRLHIACKKTTTAHVRIQFNADAANNYNNYGGVSIAGGWFNNAEVGVSYISLDQTNNFGDGAPGICVLDIVPQALQNDVGVFGNCLYYNSAQYVGGMQSSLYFGSAGFSSLYLYTTGGGLSGQVWLEELSAAKP